MREPKALPELKYSIMFVHVLGTWPVHNYPAGTQQYIRYICTQPLLSQGKLEIVKKREGGYYKNKSNKYIQYTEHIPVPL